VRCESGLRVAEIAATKKRLTAAEKRISLSSTSSNEKPIS
jgi:hypothetical protein